MCRFCRFSFHFVVFSLTNFQLNVFVVYNNNILLFFNCRFSKLRKVCYDKKDMGNNKQDF